MVNFVSDCFPGPISDSDIVRHCGLLALLAPGDTIMANQGFDIADDLTPLGIRINIPPFFRGKQQFEPRKLIVTHMIACLHIHKECCMEWIKKTFIYSIMYCLHPSKRQLHKCFLFVLS